MSPEPAPPAVEPLPGWERILVGLILAGFVVVGLNNIHNLAFIGQDFSFHVGCTNRLLGLPGQWFAQDVTSRPLIYWIALDALWLTDNRATYEVASGIFLLLNAAALGLVHDTTRRFIAAPLLRVAALAFVAFLPATSISSVVFAADAMATPPFALLCWSLIRWTEAEARRSGLFFAGLAGAALVIGNFAKFTFIILPPTVLVLVGMLWRWGRLPRRNLWALVVLAVAVPSATGLWLYRKSQSELAGQPAWHRFDWRGTGEMTWRSLLLPKAEDAAILDAPGYWDRAPGGDGTTLPLLIDNRFSYPALLHLGLFTDVLDFALAGSTDIGVPRPQPQKRFSQWSVRAGLVFSVTAVLAVAVFWWRTILSCVRPGREPRTGAVVWGVLAMAWYAPLVVVLPFVHHAYDWGYWLPRLVMPGIWGFALCLFAHLDAAVGRYRPAAALVTAATAGQVGLFILSVWY
jgi:hypothetical protein